MFLFPLIVAVLAFAVTAGSNAIPNELDNVNTFAILIMFAAIYIDISGITLAGWIRSRLAGIITTIFRLVTMCVVTCAVSILFPAT